MHSKANAMMRAYIESQSADGGGGNGASAAADPLAGQTPAMGDEAAQTQWAGS